MNPSPTMIALVCALLLSFSFVSANEANQQYFRVGLADEALPGGDNLRRATKKAKQGQGREKDDRGWCEAPESDCGNDKIFLCHKNDKTICVHRNGAFDGHLKQHQEDYCGPCLSPTAKAFVMSTWLEGNVTQNVSEPVEVESDEEERLLVSGFVTTRNRGIISLAEFADLIEQVDCYFEYGGNRSTASASITFKEKLLDTDLSRMFPSDALLVIKEDFFGSCFPSSVLEPNATNFPFDQQLYESITATGDGYILIKAADLSQDGFVVQAEGKSSYFFDMFEDGHLNMELLSDDDARRLDERNLGKKTFGINKVLSPPGSFLVVEAKGSGTVTYKIKHIEGDFGWWGFDFKVKLQLQLELKANIITSLDVGISPIKVEGPALLVQVAPVPLKLLELLKKIGIDLGNLPDAKLGLYFEILLFAEIRQVVLPNAIGPFVKYDSEIGTKEATVRMRVDFRQLAVDISADLTRNDAADQNFDAGIVGLDDSPDERLEVEVFLGFSPQIVLYLSKFASAGVGLDLGASFTAASDSTLFPPIPPEELAGAITKGPCDTCHNIQARASAVLGSPNFIGSVAIPIEIFGWTPPPISFEEPLLPGEPKSEELFLAICALGDRDQTCGNQCCEGEQSCVDGSCRLTTCNAGNTFERRVQGNRCSGPTTFCSEPGSFTCYCDTDTEGDHGCFRNGVCGSDGCPPVCSGRRCFSSDSCGSGYRCLFDTCCFRQGRPGVCTPLCPESQQRLLIEDGKSDLFEEATPVDDPEWGGAHEENQIWTPIGWMYPWVNDGGL